MQKIFIVDASGYLYSSYFAIRNMTNSKGESTNALYGFIRSVQKLIKDFQPTHLLAVFDGPKNGKKRLEIYPEYKAHRTTSPQDLPYQITWAQEFCTIMGIPHLNIPEVEADDTIGAVTKWAEKQGAEVYICSTDKDLAQLVNEKVFLLNTRKENLISGVKEVEENFGVRPDQIVDLLALIGDSSDNVPGVAGVGPKTAGSLLKQFGSLDQLLNSPEKSDKKRALIQEHADKALLSRKLVTLDLDVPIPNVEEFYCLLEPQKESLKVFYANFNFNSLLKELDAAQGAQVQTPVKQTEMVSHCAHYVLVDEEEGLASLLSFLKTQAEIGFKSQTTDSHPMQAKLLGMSFAVEPGKAWYVPLNGKLDRARVLPELISLFADPHKKFYGHNVKYELHVLRNEGISISQVSFDVLIASYLLSSHHRQHSLDALLIEHFATSKQDLVNLIGKGKKIIALTDVPLENMCVYSCEEVDYICRLKHLFEKQLKERGLESLMQTLELPLMHVLAKMERRGIFLDVPFLEQISHVVLQELENLKQSIYQIAGEEFNVNSPKQLGEIMQNKLSIPLPKKTASGFSTNAEILESLKEDHPIAGAMVNYRVLEKLRSTYIQSLPLDVNPQTHRIHCTFNQSVAATGRLSCQDPNLQNIPVRSETGRQIRTAFCPQHSNWKYLAADYSQIELRLLAHFSEDPTLIQAFQNHEDIHTSTAAAIFNIPLDQVTKEQRYQAKAVNFGILYGQQAFGLAKELKIDVKAAAVFIERYFQRFSHVKEFIEKSKELVRQTGQSTTYIGRQRLIPEIHSKNGQIRMLAERLAVNTPLQGTAADLIKLAMLKIDEQMKDLNMESYMILQVHDELIFEVPDHEIDRLTPLVKRTMQEIFNLKVPLIVNITIGKNWKEC
jgi:DNA polymerase I